MIRTGILQFTPAFLNREESIRRVEKLVEGTDLPDLLVLPELADTGYNFPDRDTAWNIAMPVHWNPFLEYLHGLAEERNIHIVSGVIEKAGNKLYNTAVLIGPHGLIGLYRKVHLFMAEKSIFTPGRSSLKTWPTGIGRIGIQICFDWMFPEPWRVLALDGAEIIAHPSNLVLPYAQSVIPSYSLVNRLFILTANRTGEEHGLKFTGGSIIAGTQGETLAKASTSGQELIQAEIDPVASHDKMITFSNHAFLDRVPELYAPLVDLEKRS